MQVYDLEKKSLFNSISQQLDTEKICLYDKGRYKAKHQLLINKRERTGLKHLNESKTFIEYSNDIDDIYRNIEKYSPIKKHKVLIVFDYMIVDMLSNKNLIQ